MATLADEFRVEARKNPGSVAKRKIGGWTFCLSYGAVDMAEASRALDAGMTVRVDGRDVDVTEQVVEKLRTWDAKDQAVAEEAMKGEWMLSAKTAPPGRKPTKKDLVFLGRTLVALHVPEGAGRYDQLVAGTLHWIWRDS